LGQDTTKYLYCIICGGKYKGCRTCKDRIEYNPWRAVSDTPQHYQIYRVIQDLNGGVVSKAEAKEMLQNINIGIADLDNFLPDVKAFLEGLFIETPVKKSKPIIKKEEIEEILFVDEPEKEPLDEQ
jgi:hypothetical protein